MGGSGGSKQETFRVDGGGGDTGKEDWTRLCVSANRFSCIRLFATLWTLARQAPLSMGFSRQEYCSGLPWPPPGELPNPGITPASPGTLALQVDSLPLSHPGSPSLGKHLRTKETMRTGWTPRRSRKPPISGQCADAGRVAAAQVRATV